MSLEFIGILMRSSFTLFY